ncbi:MAG: hypothetical protein MUO26_02525 [Methanotrichaceae archaeon]|nr:hypothetical protein [Methanotrichaceae archaeon]
MTVLIDSWAWSYTAFYGILADGKIVYIRDIMTIEQAHNLYGRSRKFG